MTAVKGKTAVVLLSGGLDSATVLAIAREEGFACRALSFDYGQRHRALELRAARRVARALGAAEHRVVKIDLSAAGGFGHSALTDDIAVPKDEIPLVRTAHERSSGLRQSKTLLCGAKRSASQSGVENRKSGIPPTYVPARNTIFLSLALGYAEVAGAFDIFIGVNAIDYSGYPDCRPAFVAAFQGLANLATAAAVEGRGRYVVHAPLLRMNKRQIIRAGLALGVNYALTHSCYDPSKEGLSCGRCDACRLRLAGFDQAGVVDPIQYQQG